LEAEERERKKVPHQLPPLLSDYRTIRILNVSPQAFHRVFTDVRRNTGCPREDPTENKLSGLQTQVIRGRLIVAAHEDLALSGLEARETSRLGIAPQNPIEIRNEIVKGSVERGEELGSTAGYGDAPVLAPCSHDRILGEEDRWNRPSPSAVVIEGLATEKVRVSPRSAFRSRELETSRLEWSVARDMRPVPPIPAPGKHLV